MRAKHGREISPLWYVNIIIRRVSILLLHVINCAWDKLWGEGALIGVKKAFFFLFLILLISY